MDSSPFGDIRPHAMVNSSSLSFFLSVIWIFSVESAVDEERDVAACHRVRLKCEVLKCEVLHLFRTPKFHDF